MALLKFKRSAVPAKIPSIADLDLGELAINTYDGKVYTKKDDGTQAIVEVGGGGGVQTIASADGSVTVTGTTDIDLSVAVAAATTTIILPVRNNTGATLAKGTAVYINGALGQNPTVTKAIATSDATSAQTLGLVTANISNNAVGNVTLIGTLTNLDTSAYSDGQQLYLSPTTAGALTATKPYAPNHMVYMAVVEHAHPTQGKLFVKVQNGYEMDELHDVSAQNPANNDGLFYNTSTSLWEKKSIPTALGYTPANRAGDNFTGAVGFLGGSAVSTNGDFYARRNSGTTGVYYFAAGVDKYLYWDGSTYNFGGAGPVIAPTSFRAPIFYDSANTAYYTDPASTSNLVGLTVANTITGSITGSAGSLTNFTNSNAANPVAGSNNLTNNGVAYVTGMSLLGQSDGALYAQAYSSSWVHQIFGDYRTGQIALRGKNNGTWQAWRTVLDSSNYTSYAMPSGSSATNNVDVRAPVFYDSVSTAYYLDPNSTSNLVGLTVANTITGSISGNAATVSNITNLTNLGKNSLIAGVVDGLTTTNFRTTMFGNAASTYNIVTSRWNSVPTAFSGLGAYGTAIAWSGSDTHAFLALNYNSAGAKIGGGSGNNINWSADLLHSANYTSYAMPIGSSATNSVDVRAPIFYDSNDTAYYVDPNGNSNFIVAYANEFYSRGWFRNNNSNTGLYNQATAQHWWSDSGSYWNMGGGNINGQGIRFRDTHNGTVRGYVYYDQANNVGFLNNAGNWRARVVGGDYFLADGSSARAQIFYDSNNTGFYVDGNATSNLSRLSVAGRSMAGSATLDMSGLDQNTWYPVTIPINTARQTRLRIENALNSNAPSWSTHPAGFSCYVEWTSNGAGWGTIGLNRRVVDWRESFTSVQIVGGIDQLTQSSTEVIWLRGGGNYFFSADNDVNPTIRTSTYEINGQTVSPRTAIYNTPWAASTGQTGAAIFYATSTITSAADVRAPVFYDTNNTGYYVDPNSTSNLFNLTISGGGHKYLQVQSIDSGEAMVRYLGATGPSWYVGKRTSTSLVDTASFHFYSESAGATVGGIDVSGNMLASGSMRAPIFYDSNNTGYYVDPASTSVLNETQTFGVSNIYDVSTNHAFGIFFANNKSQAYGIFREEGAWTHPYPDLRIAFHTGIKMGANAGYGGMKFYTDYDMSSQVMSINNGADGLGAGHVFMNNALQVNGDIRTPIFYDVNDTFYYINPNSNSVLYKFENINQRVAYDRAWGNYPSITVYNTTDQGPQNDFRIHGIGGANGGDFAVRLLVDGDITSLANINAGGAFYGQGFYDSNNTGYYLDASSGGTSLNVAGSIVAAGNVTAYSDIRVKANVETIPSALDKLDLIRGVTYTRTDLDDKEQRYAGVIAQEIEAVLPEAVRDLGNIKAVDYNATIALLIQAVKELRDEVEALRK